MRDLPLYLSVDVDVLDPAFAPGISHHEPGGWSTRQLVDVLHVVAASGAPVIAADLVEITPARDINAQTAMVRIRHSRSSHQHEESVAPSPQESIDLFSTYLLNVAPLLNEQ